MTEGEVHEAVAMLLRRFPEFPLEQEAVWVQSLALADADDVFRAVRTWCERRTTWPFVVEITEMVARMTSGMRRGREVLWHAYRDECARQGRPPSAEFLQPVDAA